MSRSHRTRSLALATLVVALVLALALSLRGGSGAGTAFAAAAPAHRLMPSRPPTGRSRSPAPAMSSCSPTRRGRERHRARQRRHERCRPGRRLGQDEGRPRRRCARSTRSSSTDDDLVTDGVNTSRDWEHEGRFVSDQSLSVTIHDPARSGAVIAAATAAGADSVDGPSFSLAEQSAAYRDALRARSPTRARRPMPPPQAMGVKILGTTTISESSSGGGPIMYARRRAPRKAASSAPPVQIGPVTVSAQVTVTFVYDASGRPLTAASPRARARRLTSRSAARGSLVRPAAR